MPGSNGSMSDADPTIGIGDAAAQRLERPVVEDHREPDRHPDRRPAEPGIQDMGRDGRTWMAHIAGLRAALSCLAMGTLRISAGDLHFTGHWVDGSARTIEAIRGHAAAA